MKKALAELACAPEIELIDPWTTYYRHLARTTEASAPALEPVTSSPPARTGRLAPLWAGLAVGWAVVTLLAGYSVVFLGLFERL